MVNFGPLRLRSVGEFGAPQLISTGSRLGSVTAQLSSIGCPLKMLLMIMTYVHHVIGTSSKILEMWANAQRDGRPAEYRWRPLFNAAKFG